MDRVAEMQQKAAAATERRLIEPTILSHATTVNTSLIIPTASNDSLSLSTSSAIKTKPIQKKTNYQKSALSLTQKSRSTLHRLNMKPQPGQERQRTRWV